MCSPSTAALRFLRFLLLLLLLLPECFILGHHSLLARKLVLGTLFLLMLLLSLPLHRSLVCANSLLLA